ncbi:MAG TPA: NADH-quinone oxidoreductase subunit J [Ktedonobacterales bacterium]
MSIDLATVAFWVIAFAIVGSALMVVVSRNIVHAALFLVVVFGAASGVYILLNAEFIAIVQILIYAGAVTILLLFAIMLTQNSMARNSNPFSGQWWLAGIICVLLGGGIIYAVSNSPMATGLGSPTSPINLAGVTSSGGTIVRIGQLLYSPFAYSYLLPFEIASVVLLVAIIGAIVIGREE